MIEWMKLHPWMTFFIAGAVVAAPAAMIQAARGPTDRERELQAQLDQTERMNRLSQRL